MREQYDDDVNARNYWPQHLPPRELAGRAIALLASGESQASIGRRTGLTTNRMLAISRFPEKYDPVDDKVAINRALSGDRTVLPALTFFERDTVLDLLSARLASEPWDFTMNNWHTEPHEAHWLDTLAADWGTDGSKLRIRVGRRSKKAAA